MSISESDSVFVELRMLNAFGDERQLRIHRHAQWCVAEFRLSDVAGLVRKRHATDIMCHEGFADFLVTELKRFRLEEIESSHSFGHLDGVSYSLRLNLKDAVLDREWINPSDRRTRKLTDAIESKYLDEGWILRHSQRFPPRHASPVNAATIPASV